MRGGLRVGLRAAYRREELQQGGRVHYDRAGHPPSLGVCVEPGRRGRRVHGRFHGWRTVCVSSRVRV